MDGQANIKHENAVTACNELCLRCGHHVSTECNAESICLCDGHTLNIVHDKLYLFH